MSKKRQPKRYVTDHTDGETPTIREELAEWAWFLVFPGLGALTLWAIVHWWIGGAAACGWVAAALTWLRCNQS
jgi:hypothetical protein